MQRLDDYLKLAMVNFAKYVIPNSDEISLIINGLGNGPRSAEILIQPISNDRKAFVFRSLGWMAKIGLIRIVS